MLLSLVLLVALVALLDRFESNYLKLWLILPLLLMIAVPIFLYHHMRAFVFRSDGRGPFILFEDLFLTVPTPGGNDLGMDLRDVTMHAELFWLRKGEEYVVDGRQCYASIHFCELRIQLEQPELVVRIRANVEKQKGFGSLGLNRTYQWPRVPEGASIHNVEIWDIEFPILLDALRNAGIHEGRMSQD